MPVHRYTLQPYAGPSSRFICPGCNHRNKTFKRYVDTQTGQYLAPHVGRCDREQQCGYHYTPSQFFRQNAPIAPIKSNGTVAARKGFSHLPVSLVNGSINREAYKHNNFILFLIDVFGKEKALKAAERYKIGTANHWPGATVFWQIDNHHRVRTGKIMLYDRATCKRVKQPFNHIAWVHSLKKSERPEVGKSGSKTDGQVNNPALHANHLTDFRTSRLTDFTLKQCLFGEHLLSEDADAVVGITESEKTAIMASIMMPQFTWLAAGSLHGLQEDKCRVLQNRQVVLFPDVGAYDYWASHSRILNLKIPTANFTVHTEMEQTATPHERTTHADMADRWIAER